MTSGKVRPVNLTIPGTRRPSFILTLKRLRGSVPCYVLALPAIIYTLCFGYLTLPYMLIAFQKYNVRKGLFGSMWIGLRNFQAFFLSNRWIVVTMNTLKINFFAILIGAIFAVVMAIVLSEVRFKRFAKVNQSMFIFPNFLSWIVVSYMVYGFLSAEYGLVNQALKNNDLSIGGMWIWHYLSPASS